MTIKNSLLSVFAILTLVACSNDNNSDTNPSQCETAIETTIGTKQNYESATEEKYTQACNAYKTALISQQQVCGDSDGSLQALIASLGNCSISMGNEVEGQISVKAGTLSIVFDEITINQEGGIL